MDRKKFLSPLFYVLPMTILFIALHTFLPRPIVEDVDNSQIFFLSYNPYFERNMDDFDRYINITDYDEAAVLDCLARYSERRSLSKNELSHWMGDVQFQIILDTGNGDASRVIYLGNLNYSCQGVKSPMYNIKDADALIAELLTLLDLDSQDNPPEA